MLQRVSTYTEAGCTELTSLGSARESEIWELLVGSSISLWSGTYFLSFFFLGWFAKLVLRTESRCS